MPIKPAFLPAIQELEDEIGPLEEQIRPTLEIIKGKRRLINQLCESSGEPPRYPEVDGTKMTAKLGPSRGDEYTGRPLATVVREIMEKRKSFNLGAAHIDELYETLKAGGYAFDNRDPALAKRNTAITLGKNVLFMRVPDTQSWGLAEWYPGLKRKTTTSVNASPTPGNELPEDPDLPDDISPAAP